MLKPRARTALSLVALVAGSLAAASLPAAAVAGHSAVLSSHAKECADSGLKNAGSMSLISTTKGTDSSGKHTSRARAWVYGVAGTAHRCVVTQTRGAKVRRKAGQSTDYSVGHLATTDGRVVLDTGEVLPVANALSGFGAASDRAHLGAEVFDVVEKETVGPEAATFLPPSLAGLVGHEGTVEMVSMSIDLHTQAWTTRRLAKPLTKAQQRKKRAAEVKVAKARHSAAVAEARRVRDEQFALAATETGLAAAWRTYMATEMFSTHMSFAKMSLREGKQLARQRARAAGGGSDTREAYLHKITLVVPLG